MKAIDYIVLSLVVLSIIIGAIFGLSRRIRKSPFGIISWILSFITSFTILSFVISIPSVNELLRNMINNMLEKDNWFLTFLVKIRFEIIMLAVIITVIVVLIKYFVCKKVADILEYDNKASFVLNKVLGAVYMLALVGVIFLVTIEIFYLSNGTNGFAYNAFNGSILKMDYLYQNNPIVSVFRYFKDSYEKATSVLEASYYGII